MPGNTDPIWSRVGDLQSLNGAVAGPTANTAQDGTSSATSMYSVAQADATNGGYIRSVIAKPVGSPAATVLRVYWSSITGVLVMGTTNTAANTFFIRDLTLLSVTLNQTLGTNDLEVPLNLALPPGYRILASFGTSTGAAGTGYVLTAVMGKY